MIAITFLLLVILLLALRFTLKRFLRKSPTTEESCGPADRHQRRRGRGRGGRGRHVVHMELDPDTPYAVVHAPPSYGDTVLADRRLQHQQQQQNAPAQEEEETELILEDVLSSNDRNDL